MKTFELRIFVNFFSLKLDALVGAGIGERDITATLAIVLAGGDSGVAVTTLVEGPAGDGSAVLIVRGVIELLPAGTVGLHT